MTGTVAPYKVPGASKATFNPDGHRKKICMLSAAYLKDLKYI